MNPIKTSVFAAILLSASQVGATVTLNLNYGKLTDVNASTVSDDSLWAFVYDDNGDGLLPGGLEPNSSLTSADVAAANAAFGGLTIEKGTMVDGDRIVFTGAIDAEGNDAPGVMIEVLNFDLSEQNGENLATGRRWGLYWFPSLTSSSNTLPGSGAFQIGGFQEDNANGESGGQMGMKIPADGGSSTVAYYDTTLAPTSGLDPARFQAINAEPVPEPSSQGLLLGILSTALLWRRRK